MFRKKRKATRRRRKRKPAGGFSFFWFMATRLFLGGLVVLIVLGVYLDREIRNRFDGNIHAQPATVYARPAKLEPGMGITIEQLSKNLKLRGYRSLGKINQPGSFTRQGELMDLFVRPVSLADGEQSAMAVRLTFSGNKIKSLVHHKNGKTLPYLFLDAERIGSLQLGSYEDRISLRLHEMPELLVKALLVMEDRNFEKHFGIDFKAIARALWHNLRNGRALQGGSTLTQQLVKNLFLTPKRTLSRKAMEAAMAIVMELRYSKSEILTLYVNEIFLGQSGNRAVHGFALASQFYFGRPLSQLQLHETAMLVGMIPAPSYYNPRRHPQRSVDRRNLVLSSLAEFNAISDITAQTLASKPLGVINQKSTKGSKYPAYIDYVHRQLRQYFSEDVLRSDGLKLFTSLDIRVQRSTQQALSEMLDVLDKQRGFKSGTLQGAAVVIEISSGEILALVGDRVAGYSGFNRAVDAQRPIGSLVKPAVYLSALEKPRDYSLATLLQDTPLTLEPRNSKPWSPQNYDKQYRGEVTAIDALTHSYNVPTVRLGLQLGVDSVVETMKRLGIEREINPFPSTLLGASAHSPLEMAQLYQSIANDGLRVALRSIRSINNSRGTAIARFPSNERRVIDQNSAYLIDFALQEIVNRGTAARLSGRYEHSLGIAGKTGTTDNYRDSWFAGYAGQFLTVVWVGRDDNKPTGLTGSSGALRVWDSIMSALPLQGMPTVENNEIVFHDVDAQTGLRASGACENTRRLPFVAGFQPTEKAPCAGIVGRVQNWFNIDAVDSLELTPVEERSN